MEDLQFAVALVAFADLERLARTALKQQRARVEDFVTRVFGGSLGEGGEDFGRFVMAARQHVRLAQGPLKLAPPLLVPLSARREDLDGLFAIAHARAQLSLGEIELRQQRLRPWRGGLGGGLVALPGLLQSREVRPVVLQRLIAAHQGSLGEAKDGADVVGRNLLGALEHGKGAVGVGALRGDGRAQEVLTRGEQRLDVRGVLCQRLRQVAAGIVQLLLSDEFLGDEQVDLGALKPGLQRLHIELGQLGDRLALRDLLVAVFESVVDGQRQAGRVGANRLQMLLRLGAILGAAAKAVEQGGVGKGAGRHGVEIRGVLVEEALGELDGVAVGLRRGQRQSARGVGPPLTDSRPLSLA